MYPPASTQANKAASGWPTTRTAPMVSASPTVAGQGADPRGSVVKCANTINQGTSTATELVV